MKDGKKHNFWTWQLTLKWAIFVFIVGYLLGMVFASMLTADLYPTDDFFNYYYDPFIQKDFWIDTIRILF